MKSMKTTIAAMIATGAILGGCASTSSDPYYSSTPAYGGYSNTASMGYGTIESIQVTRGSGSTSGAGAVVGGLVGAVVGNQIGSGSGRTAATVAGAVGGAALGNKVEGDRNASGRDMYQINVRMDNGEYRTVVQDSVYDLRVGNRIRIVDGRAYRY
ncbi:MAG: glycine zipper 2TM domain-containing protein [Telluria sp.]